MPSPFPGMNPYLEQEDVWQDFHQTFIPRLRETLVAQIAPGYLVRVEEQLYVHELPAHERRFLGRTDVGVSPSGQSGSLDSTGTAVTAPVRGRFLPAVDVERHAYLEIRDRRNREVVTVIELLSPSNKYAGPDREQYLAKRRQIYYSPTHLVEIDLMRGGPRLPVEGLPDCDYCAMVSRAEDRPDVGLWPLQLHDTLPVIPIPLRAPDPAVLVDLQKVLHRTYDEARYADYIYTGSPQPRLSPMDAEWARQFVPTSAA